jgi:hypothetical protein
MRWGENVARVGQVRNKDKICSEKMEGKKARRRQKWTGKDNIKANFKGTGCGAVDSFIWRYVVGALASSVMSLWVL